MAQRIGRHAGILGSQHHRADPLAAKQRGARLRIPESQYALAAEGHHAGAHLRSLLHRRQARLLRQGPRSLLGRSRRGLPAGAESARRRGARYIQLDDTSIAFICDPQHREYVRSWGEDPMQLLETYAQKINEALAGLPADVTIRCTSAAAIAKATGRRRAATIRWRRCC